MSNAFIVGAVRTAGGRRDGKLSGWHPIDLGAAVVDELLARTGADPGIVEDVIFGCVGQTGAQSANITRSVVLSSRLGEGIPGTTIDRACGSSQQAMHFAAQAVMSGVNDVVITGGVESMSTVPLGGAVRAGYKAGYGLPNGKRIEERYPGVRFDQFVGGEMIAKQWDISREDLDRFGLTSHQRAGQAAKEGRFDREIFPVEVETAEGGTEKHERDEGIRSDGSMEKMAALKPLIEGGKLTAGTSSQICDGASAMLIANENGLKALSLEPRARFHTMVVAAGDPVMMLAVPIAATQKLLARAGLRMQDIDLYEVNEAFASVAVAWTRETGADPDRLNVNGGAIALGHPLGCSGVKLMTTLLHELEARERRYGLETMCEGGGMANATLIERC